MRARRAVVGRFGLAALVAASLLVGCGADDGGGARSVADEKASDAEVLNVAIGQEMTLVDGLYTGLPHLRRARDRSLFRQLIAQEREHIDGFTKALRGLGGQVDAEAEELDLSGVSSEDDALLLAYGLTSSQLTHFLDDVTHLQTRAPQSFAASIAASQAQHLVVLRELLGASRSEAVPEAFDTGEVPPPAASPGGTAP